MLLMVRDDDPCADALGVQPAGVDIDYNSLFEQTLNEQVV
jgi:hypothetical protein